MEENKNEITVMTVEESQAVQANDLVNNGLKLAQMGIAQMCAGVKMMHDGKLYKHFGFQNFEDYCKSKGFTRQQGNRFIKVAEMLEQENVTTMLHFEKLGTAKLFQLAMLEPEQREEVMQTVDVENVTVKELKSEISTLKQNNRQLEDKQKQFQSALESKTNELEDFRAGAKRRQDNLIGNISKLKAEIEGLKANPETVTVEDTSRIEELTEELNRMQAQLAETQQQLETAQARLAEHPGVQEVLPVSAPPDRREIFRAYLTAASDGLKRLYEFMGKFPGDPDMPFFLEKTEHIIGYASSELNRLKGE